MRSRLDRVLLLALTIAALAMATALVKREFFPSAVAPGRADITREPSIVPNWRGVVAEGIELGDPRAPVKLVEFTDLECPFCRRFHTSRLPDLVRRFSPNVSAVFIHFPLSIHKFAEPAARASECAREQDVFGPFVDAVFANQDSLGLRPWSAFALDAGVRDTARFNLCFASSRRSERIDAGMRIGERIGIRATPGIMVNEWLYPTPPSDIDLIARIERLLREREPKTGS